MLLYCTTCQKIIQSSVHLHITRTPHTTPARTLHIRPPAPHPAYAPAHTLHPARDTTLAAFVAAHPFAGSPACSSTGPCARARGAHVAPCAYLLVRLLVHPLVGRVCVLGIRPARSWLTCMWCRSALVPARFRYRPPAPRPARQSVREPVRVRPTIRRPCLRAGRTPSTLAVDACAVGGQLHACLPALRSYSFTGPSD